MGKDNGQKLFRLRKYLLWTLNEVLDTANECSVTNESDDTFVSVFDRKLSFRQLYDFIKLNKEYVYNRNIPHAIRLCEICEKAVYFMKGLNNWLRQTGCAGQFRSRFVFTLLCQFTMDHTLFW